MKEDIIRSGGTWWECKIWGFFGTWRELPVDVNCTCFVVSRYIGTVLAVKPKKGATCRVRVKFDMYPKDKYDKW